MPSIAEALNAALRHHQAGQYAQAEQIYRQVLAADPRQVDAWHLLGLVSHQSGHSDLAIQYLEEALRLNPDFPDAHYNLGNVYREIGKPSQAAASYHRSLQLRPNNAEAHYNLGNALQDLRQYSSAVESYQQALRLRPNYAKALNNLGNAYMDLGQPALAAEVYRQTLQMNPNYAKGYNNLGNALRQLGRLDEAVAHCRRALELEPGNSEALNNLAAALLDQAKAGEALAAFEEALAVRPDYAEAHMNRAMAWLLLGDYRRGWEEYEWRWQSKAFTPRNFTQPLWDGSELAGSTILIHAEQGLGDTLHFVRYVPLVQQRGGRVLLECSPTLHKLLGSITGIDELLAAGQPLPAFDVHAPLLSLPHLLGLPDPKYGPTVPYLSADPTLLDQWRAELEKVGGFQVGINWQGNPNHPKDRQRSIPLAEFLPLATVSNVRLISLQKGHGIEQLQTLPNAGSILDLGSRLDETSGAFMDTAAVLKNLDFVITSDTALAHLAGALGVPAWVALSTTPDWRWLLEGNKTPWYPSMRLFRQTELGDWKPVFERIAAELQPLAAARTMGP